LQPAEQLARRNEGHGDLQTPGLAQESDIPADEIVRAGGHGGCEHRRVGAVHTGGESLYLIGGGIRHDLRGRVEEEFAEKGESIGKLAVDSPDQLFHDELRDDDSDPAFDV
jgi:hypothetical protein